MESPAYVPITYEKRNVLEYVLENMADCRDRTAVVSSDGAVRLKYGEMNERANRLAHALSAMGIGKGQRVALFQTNNWKYMEQYLACLKLGAICVPMNFRLKSPEALYILNESGATVLILEERYVPVFEPIRPYLLAVKHYISAFGTSPAWAVDYEELLAGASPAEPPVPAVEMDDVCAICYTSGTTGLPKGSMSTHRNIMVNFHDAMKDLGEYAKDPDLGYSINLTIVPMYHIAGILSLYATMSSGSTIVIPEGFTTEIFLRTVEKERVTITYLVPTLFAFLLADPNFSTYDLSSLRVLPYGAMPMPPDLLKRILKEFPPHIKYMDAFGCTECNATSIAKLPEDHDILKGTEEEIARKIKRLSGIGRPLYHGIETKVIDEHGRECPPGVAGEIVCRGDKVTPGYWRNPEQTALAFDKDGWFHTGDMGWRDEDGYYYFGDRSKDMINRGGENIFPVEIERVLAQHPGVMDVAVFGAPDPTWGNIVAAAVVLRPGETVPPQELIDFCKGKLASFKAPTVIEFVDALPRTFEGGKVQRRVLRERFIEKQRHNV